MTSTAPELNHPSTHGDRPAQSASGPQRLPGEVSVLDQLSMAVFLLSRTGNVLECNRAASSFLTSTCDQIRGKPLFEVFNSSGPNAAIQIQSAVERAANGSPARLELNLHRHDGAEAPRVFRLSFQPLTVDGGDSPAILVEASEITEERNRIPEAERLLDSAQRESASLRGMLSQIPAGIGITSGPDHRWTFINDDYVRLTGRLSADEFIGKTAREVMPELESQGFPALLDKVYSTGQPYFGREARAQVNRSGRGMPEEGFFDFLYQPVHNPEGQIEGIFIYVVEVTGIIQARRAVEENAERLRLAQSAARIGVWEWDPIRETQTLSSELHRIFGTDPSDADRIAKWASRVHPADLSRVQMLMTEGHRLGSMEFEYRYIHPDLGLRWLFCKGHRRPSETRMFGVVQDITIRKNAEIAAQRLAAIVESSDDAIVSKDLTGIVTSWNAGAQRIFGYTPDEMIGQSITKIIPPELYNDETRILTTIARGERIEHFETVRVHKSGKKIEVSLTVSPVRDQSGNIVGAAKIARDITQQKKAERALRTSERLASVGRLAATVAHEINNPLEAVTNLIYLAKNAPDPSTYLKMAEEEVERVSHLTRQTLGFYRETKSAVRVSVGDLVDSLLSVFTPRLRNKNVQLTSDIRTERQIIAVPGEVRQVIANLLSNSIDALAQGGRICIRVSNATLKNSHPIPGVRLTIADNGVGIPPGIRSRLFEPFFTTKKDVGTGLGLWICKSIVQNHNGVMRLRSCTTPGKSGTVFSIFLPSEIAPVDESAVTSANASRATL